MTLIDSNIIIYASKPGYEFLHATLAQADVAVSVVSEVETLGHHQLTASEKSYLGEFFANVTRLPITEEVIQQAIKLRQTRKMSLGDSLVASTALVHGASLTTRNTDDFKWIPNLTSVNPFDAQG